MNQNTPDAKEQPRPGPADSITKRNSKRRDIMRYTFMILAMTFVLPLWIHFVPAVWCSPDSSTMPWRIFFTALVIFESVMLVWMAWDLKRKPEAPVDYIRQAYFCVPALFLITFLFSFIFGLFTSWSDRSFLTVEFLDYLYLHLVELVIFPSMAAVLKPTGRERAWIANRLDLLHGRANDLKMDTHQAPDREVVDELASAISNLEKDARAFGHPIDTRPTRDMLPELYARCSIRESTGGAKAISIEKLRVASGLPEDQFSMVLIKMCGQLGLVIDGKTVKAKDGQDMGALIEDVDGFFARWREGEAVRLGRSKGIAFV